MAATGERHGAVGLIRFAEPPHDILSARGVNLLAAAFDELLDDSTIRAVVITGGENGVFIRHYHLAAITKAAQALKDGVIGTDSFLDAAFAKMTDRIAGSPVPVIAAINGICMGGGFEIALACDLRIAQRDVAHIGLPEIRVDILPGGGGTQRLARLIGEGPALDIALRGRTVTAERAYQLGIVGDVVEDALAAAMELAQTLAAREPLAVAAIKSLVRGAHDDTLAEGLNRERLAFGTLLQESDRAMDSMRAVLDTGTMLEDVGR